jgi:hypothetical protein
MGELDSINSRYGPSKMDVPSITQLVASHYTDCAIPAEIRTEHLPNVSQEVYRFSRFARFNVLVLLFL